VIPVPHAPAPTAAPAAPTALREPVLPGPPAPRPHSDDAPSDRFLAIIPRDFARRHLLVSRGIHQGAERLWIAPTTSPAAVHNVGVRLAAPVEPTPADPDAIAAEIDRHYGLAIPAASLAVGPDSATHPDPHLDAHPDAHLDALIARADTDLLSTSGKAPVVRLVDALLFEALGRGASDVHIQPLADRTLIRYRVDGVLHDVRSIPPALTLAVASRVKVMGRMDVAERRLAQDGRATVGLGADGTRRAVDLRISSFPTSYGERIVLRLLDPARAAHLLDFASLGMPAAAERLYLARAARSSGILLVAGPTGSGKTTTLYATLRWVAADGGAATGPRARGQNILTIEDPIEYELSTVGLAVSQAQVNARKGVTFATGLRHLLRQDPDVIMVGEIRDAETARVAIQASLTGHLVLSTIHTNDAVGAVPRLIDLGVEPYLIAASLSATLAQRLVRIVHPPCAGRGCTGCLDSGYRGRRGVFELFLVDDPLRDLIAKAAPATSLASLASSRGMRTLADEGRRLVAEGVTTDAECARVLQGVE